MTDAEEGSGLWSRAMAIARHWWDLLVGTWEQAVRVVPGLDLAAELASRFGRLNGSVLVGHIAYRAFVWVIPLLLVAVGLLGYGAAEGLDIVRYGREAGLDEDLLATTSEQAGGAGLRIALVALFGLVVATRSLVRALFFVFAQAWEIEPRLPQRPIRAVGLTMVAALVTLAVTAAMTALAGRGPLLLVGAGVTGVVATTLILLAVSWLLPHRARSVLELIPGVGLATIGIVLMNMGGGLYFPQRLSSTSEVYGNIGFTLVFLFYLWLWAFLLVASALVNAVWCDRAEILDGRPWVASPERLPGWVRRRVERLPGVGDAGGAERDGDREHSSEREDQGGALR